MQTVAPDPADPLRQAFDSALDSIDRALTATAALPLVKRKRAHFRVDNELDDAERLLVEAVLPAHD